MDIRYITAHIHIYIYIYICKTYIQTKTALIQACHKHFPKVIFDVHVHIFACTHTLEKFVVKGVFDLDAYTSLQGRAYYTHAYVC
jgi:hypothetical protein